MRKAERVFLIVLDSVGIGEMPDAVQFGDVGSNTLKACFDTGKLHIPNLEKLGIYQLDGNEYGIVNEAKGFDACVARMTEASRGKDTTIGHWEIAGMISKEPLPTYPEGFPDEVLKEFTKQTGRKILCNKPYSGTEVIKDYGKQHVETGDLIVYTSADSVFQIAAHEEVVPVEVLYQYCETARKILTGKHGVGRVIARPFTGTYPEYKRTSNRHDFSLIPPKTTMLDELKKADLDTIYVGKIYDIFAGKGISDGVRTKSNTEGMNRISEYANSEFHGLCFANLVDFDMLYGHRNDVIGYTNALNEFDAWLGDFLPVLKKDDVLIITADHGCDPVTASTDHSREYTPCILYGEMIRKNCNLGTRATFSDIGATVCELLQVEAAIDGASMYDQIIEK